MPAPSPHPFGEASPDDWKHLWTVINSERSHRGWTLKKLYAECRVSANLLGKMRTGKPIRQQTKIANIEQGLGWEAGSIRNVLLGGEPTHASKPPDCEIWRRVFRLEAEVARLKAIVEPG